MLVSIISIVIMFACILTVKNYSDGDKRVVYLTKEDCKKFDISNLEELKEDLFIL